MNPAVAKRTQASWYVNWLSNEKFSFAFVTSLEINNLDSVVLGEKATVLPSAKSRPSPLEAWRQVVAKPWHYEGAIRAQRARRRSLICGYWTRISRMFITLK